MRHNRQRPVKSTASRDGDKSWPARARAEMAGGYTKEEDRDYYRFQRVFQK